MKKFLLTALLMLPISTWQVYSGGILTVYKGTDANSGVYYQGVASGYNGGASQKAQGKWTASFQIPTQFCDTELVTKDEVTVSELVCK